MRRLRLWPFQLAALLLIVVVAGCSAPAAPSSVPAAPAVATPDQTPAEVPSVPLATAVPTATAAPTESPDPTAEPTVTTPPEPTATPVPELSLAQSLAAIFTAAPTAAGEVILVTGQVLDAGGNPLPGAAVEFWQTDASGVYDHPGDRGTGSRDRGFQFYGTARADSDGRYVFRTIEPGYYEPRPRHIHVKVKQDGRELLTTQFYFEEDRGSLGGEGVFAQAGGLGDLLVLSEIDRVDMDGVPVAVLVNDLIVNIGSGSLTTTPVQAEGPYYPVVAVEQFDNDLAVVP